MPVLVDTLGEQGWPGGVITATDATLLGPLASPRGRNSALAFTTAGLPYVQKRLGLNTQNATAITGSPAIIGQYGYVRLANSTTYHLLYSDTGRIDRNVSGTLTNISTAFTAGTYYPSFETAKDLCFIVNGVDRWKFNGTLVQNFGIVRPVVGALAGAAGAAGSPSGVYELRVSYYNSATGNESSASDTAAATVTVTSQEINWTGIPVSTDTQVDFVNLLVRNIATMSQFYRVAQVANGTTTASTDFIDIDLVTLAPGTTTNNPPPSGIKYLALHQGRLFAATDNALYYSNLNAPEQFNDLAYEGVNPSDGQAIKAIISDHEVLKIIKEDSTYVLVGPSPNEWEIRLVDPEIGTGSHRTVVSAGGSTWWWSRHGLVQMAGSTGPIQRVGLSLYGDPTPTVNYNAILAASAGYDPTNARLVYALPAAGQTRATFLIPFNLGPSQAVMESEYWDPMDAASIGHVPDSTHNQTLYLGNYAGQVFTLWNTNNDGIRSTTTHTGTFVAAATFVNTITDVSATFDTTGSGLIERKVSVFDSNGVTIIDSARPYITANSATVLTLSAAVTRLTIGATYTYVVGGPDFQWDTPWRTYTQPWIKKRYEYFFMLSKGVSSGATAKIDLFFDYDDTNVNGKQRTLQSTVNGSLWDVAIWDVDVWDSPTAEQRWRVARVGRSWRARVRNGAADQAIAILHLAMQGVTETVKR